MITRIPPSDFQSRGRRVPWRLVICALAAAGAGAGPSVRADQPLPLAAAVAAAAKTKIVPVLEKEGIKSVGVLKFLAMEGGGPDAQPSTRLGAINSDLAAQFQTAILLNVSRKNPIAVLRDPSGVAVGIPGATHLTAEGRANLFAADYPVVVGKAGEKVKPDAFVFGIVQVADDLKAVVVHVRMIRRGSPEVQNLDMFTAALGTDQLAAAGQSFVATRGMFTGGQVGGGSAGPTPEQAAERPIKLASLAADVRAGRRKFPLEDPEAPVTLSIAYDGVIQKIEARDGGAFVAEPRQGQNVTITIRKTRADGRRYAVALKVNGENTTERNTLPDNAARKWVLSDRSMMLPVKGYSTDTESMQPFTVLSAAESARRAFDYGLDAGTITMTVFAEQTGTPEDSTADPGEPLIVQEDAAGAALDRLLLAGGARLDPRKTFETLDEAKASLQQLAANTRSGGGIIAPGDKTQSLKLKRVPFNPIPDPVMSVVVRYYTRP